MKAWFLRMFGSAPKAGAEPPRKASRKATAGDAEAAPPATAAQAARPRQAVTTDTLEAVRRLAAPDAGARPFFAWLVDDAGAAAAAGRERQALQRLDKLIASAAAGASLLPRSAAVVPRLLAILRSSNMSLPELSGQISRDLTLVAEVVRMANSPFYRPAEAVVEVEQAIRVLGVDGLRKAIARAVLKPLVDAPGGRQATHATQRLWEHTDKKAQLCSALARCLGLEAFEGYLLGLVHNAVWSVVLRTVDTPGPDGPWCIDAAFEAALDDRRDHLFGLIAQQWQLSESLTRVATGIARRDPTTMASPSALLLLAGHRLASALCGEGALPPQAWLIDVGKPLLDGCEILSRAAPDAPSGTVRAVSAASTGATA